MLCLIQNLTPIILGGGVYYLLEQDVDMGTVLVVCLGTAVDDTSHFLFVFALLANIIILPAVIKMLYQKKERSILKIMIKQQFQFFEVLK